MNICKSLQAALAVLLFFVPASSPVSGAAAQEGNFSKAVFTKVYPSVIKTTKEGGNIELFLKGKDFLIHPSGDVWNVREIFVYVRHAGSGEQWRGLYNNRREDYPNLPAENGTCAYDSDESMRVWLPKSLWCSSEGQLEFILVKGKFDGTTGELLVQVRSTSDPFRVSVRNILDGPVSWAEELYPAYYVVHDPAPAPLQVRGAYGPDSVVVVDGNDWPVTNGQAAPGWLTTAGLPAGFLDVPGKHIVKIRDQQNSPCVPATLWVYGPPVIVKIEPKGLLVGGGQANIDFTCEGLAPDKAEVQVGYVYSAQAAGGQPAVAQPAGTAVIPPKTDPAANRSVTAAAKKAPSTSVGTSSAGVGTSSRTVPMPAAAGGAPKTWTSIAMGVFGGKVRVTIPAAWLVQEGIVKVRLINKAGSVEVPVKISKPVTLAPDKSPVKVLK